MIEELRNLISLFFSPFSFWNYSQDQNPFSSKFTLQHISLLLWLFAFIESLFSILLLAFRKHIFPTVSFFPTTSLAAFDSMMLKVSVYYPIVTAISFPLIVFFYFHLAKFSLKVASSIFNQSLDQKKVEQACLAINAPTLLLLVPFIGPILLGSLRYWYFFAATRKLFSFTVFQSLFTIFVPFLFFFSFMAFIFLVIAIL